MEDFNQSGQFVYNDERNDSVSNALLSVSGSSLMLVMCILATIRLVVSLIVGNFGFTAILENILPLFMLIGFWISYGLGRSKKLNPIGAKFIKIPFAINFICYLILVGLALIVILFSFIPIIFLSVGTSSADLLLLFLGSIILIAISVVLEVLFYKSIMNCINNAIDINEGFGVGKHSGSFAAIMIFIKAGYSFLGNVLAVVLSLFGTTLLQNIIGNVDSEIIKTALSLISAVSPIILVTGLFTLSYQLVSGILLMKFAKAAKSCETD